MKLFVDNIIGNYYGGLAIYTKDSKYYLTLGNYDGDYGVEISEDLANSIKDYFDIDREIIKIDL